MIKAIAGRKINSHLAGPLTTVNEFSILRLMCGICGVLDYSRTETGITDEMITRMTDVIRHRGPDDAGAYISPDRRLGFGFRRLAIVDLSPAGHQPMSSPDGNIWIVFNGEIYNHLSLRAELEQKGYVYRSRSDTETILYGYMEWGTEIFSKMLGMWGLAIWDNRTKQLICARDRIGIKPLYYTQRDGRFLFASEIKSIFKHPAFSPEMNEEMITYYLTFLSTPTPNTLFRSIHKLEPGNFLVVNSDGTVRNVKYWDILDAMARPQLPATAASEKGIAEELIRLLRQSIKDRMMSDVPFGVFLSGGIDSSTNVALMAELMDRPVQTFTVGFKELEKYNELQYARQISERYKTNHHEVLIDHNDAVRVFDDLVWHTDEPNGDSVCIPLYFLSKLARDNGCIVLQVGEGSDEEFGGYSWMRRELRVYHSMWRYYAALPPFIRGALNGAAKNLVPLLFPNNRHLILDYFLRGAGNEPFSFGGSVDLTESHKRFLLAKRFREHSVSDLPRGFHNEFLSRVTNSEYLQRIIYFEFKQRLPESLLMRVDKIGMAHSIEARVPFLDHRIVEYAMTIPSSLKTKNHEPKYILKKAVESILPHNIIYRPKQGFNAPMQEWFRGPLAGYARDRIFSSKLKQQGIFDYEWIDGLLTDHVRGQKNGQSVWTILNFTMWWDRWWG